MKVLIIDDHRLFADGIRNLLTEYDKNIWTDYASNVFSAYEQLTSDDAPNLILLASNDNATANSYDLIKRLNSLQLEIPVMVISVSDSAAAAGLAIENNASGFICKNCSRETTLDAILSVLEGNIYLDKPKYQTPKKSQFINTEKITMRQQEVLHLLSQGLLNKQIAYELNISTNTVKAHLHDLFRHLQVSNRTAAVRNGQKYGLIK